MFLVLLLLLGALVGGVVHQRVVLTAYLPGLVPSFDLLGMTIRANIDKLEVTTLKAAHTGDTLRLSGSLQNNSEFDTHSADLLVTVATTDGTIINEQMVMPDDRIIKAGGSTPFFLQLNVEKSDEAVVTVVPIAKRITRWLTTDLFEKIKNWEWTPRPEDFLLIAVDAKHLPYRQEP